MCKPRLMSLAVLSLVLVAPPSHADSIRYVAVRDLVTVSACNFGELASGPDPDVVWIYLDLSAPAKSMQFSGPTGPNLTGVNWEYAVGGVPGVTTMDFGGCVNGSILLGTAAYDLTSPNCASLIKGPRPIDWEDSPPVLVGCDDAVRFVAGDCAAAAPTLLTPADGATGVAIPPNLSWQGGAGAFCIESIGLQVFTVYLGTTPESMVAVSSALDANQWQAPGLLPNTQYYWKLLLNDFYWEYTGSQASFSETRSFTTTTVVAVDDIEWGNLKRLYR